MYLYVSVSGGRVPDGICARWRRKAGDFCCGGTVYGIGWQCRGGDGGNNLGSALRDIKSNIVGIIASLNPFSPSYEDACKFEDQWND